MSRHRYRRRYYAKGTNAVAECMRSGQKMRYKDLVEDGHIPGLLVHPAWYESRHPQELPVDTSDAVALYRPAPEISVNTDEFRTVEEWNAYIATQCPTSPLNLQFAESTTVATGTNVQPGETLIATEDAVNYTIGDCIFIELDGGGWFVSQAATDCPNGNGFRIPTITPMMGTASAGNQVFITIVGSNTPLMTVSWVIT